MNKFQNITNQELLNELCRRIRQKAINEDEFTWILMKITAEEKLKDYAKK